MSMTKAQAEKDFKVSYSRELKGKDIPLKRMLWNDFTDELNKSGHISDSQRMTWTQPAFVNK